MKPAMPVSQSVSRRWSVNMSQAEVDSITHRHEKGEEGDEILVLRSC